MTDSTTPAPACTRSAAPDRHPRMLAPTRATSPPPLRRARDLGIHGPRTCEHGGRGTNHLAFAPCSRSSTAPSPTPRRRRSPPPTTGFLRGDGVFEVMRLYGGRPFALDDHLTRMARSAANLRLPIDVDAVRADVETLLERNERAGDAALRVVVTRGGRRLGDRRGAQAAARHAGAGHDRVRADARARPGQVAVLRRQHARHAAWPRSRAPTRRCSSRRTAACSRAPTTVVRLLARRRDARHAAARPTTSSTRSRAAACSSVVDVDRAVHRPRRAARACARRSWPRRCARCIRSARSTAPRCRRRPARSRRTRRAGSARTSSRSCGVSA